MAVNKNIENANKNIENKNILRISKPFSPKHFSCPLLLGRVFRPTKTLKQTLQ
jgi:hypothetical protein